MGVALRDFGGEGLLPETQVSEFYGIGFRLIFENTTAQTWAARLKALMRSSSSPARGFLEELSKPRWDCYSTYAEFPKKTSPNADQHPIEAGVGRGSTTSESGLNPSTLNPHRSLIVAPIGPLA